MEQETNEEQEALLEDLINIKTSFERIESFFEKLTKAILDWVSTIDTRALQSFMDQAEKSQEVAPVQSTKKVTGKPPYRLSSVGTKTLLEVRRDHIPKLPEVIPDHSLKPP